MPKSTPLADEVAKVAERVRKATKGKLNEQNTKASMIEPVLRALGWDTEDVAQDVVQVAPFALRLSRSPRT